MNSSNRVWLIAGLLMAGFILANTFIAYRSLKDLEHNQRSVTHTLEVKAVIKDIYMQLTAAESGQRGYLITGDEPYLEPFKRSLSVLGELLAKLQNATTEIPQQERHFNELYELSIKKIDELQEGISLKQQNRDRAALNTFHDDEGYTLMEKIYERMMAMKKIENELLDRRNRESEASRKSALRTLFLANGFGIVLILVIYVVMNRHFRQRSMYTDLLRQSNEDLEQKVRERTESLEHFSEELQRSNRELQNFAFVASHDLQEPLRKIRAFGARLKQSYSEELGEKGGDYINRMFSASERMSVLIDDLLAFSRVFTQQKPFEPIDLNDIFEDVLDDLEIAINEADATVTVDDMPSINGDVSQIRRLFQNLIANSIKFRDPEKPCMVTLTKTMHVDDYENDVVVITVKDNGIGFEQKFAEKIFTLFQRLHGREEYSGTGLGLAICRRIVERHGGSIDAVSELGEGATFTIELPISPKSETLQFTNE